MHYHRSLLLIVCLAHTIEATIGPGGRKPSSSPSFTSTPAYEDESDTSSPTQRTSALHSIFNDPLPPTDTNVLHRDLMQENISPRAILEHHQAYCNVCASDRQFFNPSLVYITPWHNRGYDLAKIFTRKLDYVAPVWFRLKRVGRLNYLIEGTHDIDGKWIEELKTNNPKVRLVPRVTFENWPPEDLNALADSEAEKQKLALTLADLLREHNQLLDGYVLEILAPFHGASKPVVHHLLRDIAEHVHEIETSGPRKELILAVPPLPEYFDQSDLTTLSKYLDGFHIMTYDFPTKEPGPVSPFEWIKEIMHRFPGSKRDPSTKIFLGINFYGYRYDRIVHQPAAGESQYHMTRITGGDYLDFLKQYYPVAKIHFDNRAHEHIAVVYARAEVNINRKAQYAPQIIVFYPSLRSIYDRLGLATKYNVGIAIWEGGQGFDYFYDLF